MPQVSNLKKTRAPRRPRPLSAAVPVNTSYRRQHLTYSDKLDIIDFYRAHQDLPGVTQSLAVQRLRVKYPTLSQSTLSDYLSREQEIRDYVRQNPTCLSYKQPLRVTLPQVDAALTKWVFERLRRGVRLTGDVICEKARQFCNDFNIPPRSRIKFTHGWLDHFKERLGLREVWFHGEAASAPIDQIPPEQVRLQSILQQYSPPDCYNFDETAHFFRQVPRHALGLPHMSGVKDDKTRMSLGFCANADGSDKRRPLFIGHYEKPHAFKGNTAAALGFDYEFNRTAWMNGDVWER
jgi:hypothetical protein